MDYTRSPTITDEVVFHPPSPASRPPTLVDLCAKYIAFHSHAFPSETWAAIKAHHLTETLQKFMVRCNQIKHLHEYRSWYPDGKPEVWETYNVEGKKDGKALSWYENGRLESFLRYQNGLPHRGQKWYNPRGLLVKKYIFKNGKFKESVIIEKKVFSSYNYNSLSVKNRMLMLTPSTSASSVASFRTNERENSLIEKREDMKGPKRIQHQKKSSFFSDYLPLSLQ